MSKTPSPTIRTMTRHIRASFDTATLEEYSAGIEWYSDAHALAEQLATKYGVTVPVAAAVIAAHSANASWAVNRNRAVAHLAGYPTGLGKAIAMGNRAIADPDNALDYVVGPKLNPFAHNIAGDLSRVATDRWAQRAGFNTADDTLCARLIARKGVRDLLIEAYCKVAADVGLEPAQLQAIVWVQIRGKAE